MKIFTTIKNILGLYKEGETVKTDSRVIETKRSKTVREEYRTVKNRGLITQTEDKCVIVNTVQKETGVIEETTIEEIGNLRLTVLAKIALATAAITIFNAPALIALPIMAIPAATGVKVEKTIERTPVTTVKLG